MKPIDVAVTRLAGSRYSLILRLQLRDLGMTRLLPVHRGVYRLPGRASAEQAVLGAGLAAGHGAASRRSAARLWGVDEAPGGDHGHRAAAPSAPGRVVHWTDRLDPVDVSRVRGIPVTTPARTVLHLRAVAPVAVVESVLEDALLRVLHFTWADVRQRADEVVAAVAGEVALAWPA